MSTLFVDYRESDVMDCIRERNRLISVANPIPFESVSLPVGDLWIGLSLQQQQQQQQQQKPTEDEKQPVGGVVIERKRITDFEASFLDGRYREQRGRILAYCQQYNAQPIYILEGQWSSLTGRITKKVMAKLLNRLTLHYQIPIIHTISTEETVEWVESLWEQWNQDPSSLKRTQEVIKLSDGIHIQKKQNASDPKQFLISCLAQCTGVSIKMAESLSDVYPSLTRIMSLSQKEIEDHKVGSRRIGPAVSKRLWELLHA